METDTRAEQKFSTKYSGKHGQTQNSRWTNKDNSRHLKKKHRSRPTSMKSMSRLVLPRQIENIANKDVINHKALDFSVVEDLYRSSAAPRYRLHWELREHFNPQNHAVPKEQQRAQLKELCKYCNLPDIYEKLYIGNIHFAESYVGICSCNFSGHI